MPRPTGAIVWRRRPAGASRAGARCTMERSSRPPRYFTLDEARRTLPQVAYLHRAPADLWALRWPGCSRLCKKGATPCARRPPRTTARRRTAAAGASTTPWPAREALLGEMRRLVGELEEIGCEVKDVQTGLVDFRAMRDGRAVYLCWRLGEERHRVLARAGRRLRRPASPSEVRQSQVPGPTARRQVPVGAGRSGAQAHLAGPGQAPPGKHRAASGTPGSGRSCAGPGGRPSRGRR